MMSTYHLTVMEELQKQKMINLSFTTMIQITATNFLQVLKRIRGDLTKDLQVNITVKKIRIR